MPPPQEGRQSQKVQVQNPCQHLALGRDYETHGLEARHKHFNDCLCGIHSVCQHLQTGVMAADFSSLNHVTLTQIIAALARAEITPQLNEDGIFSSYQIWRLPELRALMDIQVLQSLAKRGTLTVEAAPHMVF